MEPMTTPAPGLLLVVPEAISCSSQVPASEPSLCHNSAPFTPLLALNRTAPFSTRKLAGAALPLPAVMSAIKWVPALVPSAARMFDFSSTVQFFRMVHNYIGKIDPSKQYRWISVLTTLFDQRYESQKQFYEVMTTCFSDSMFQRVFFHSAEVINSAAQFVGPYEQPKPNRKVLEMMDSVFGEIEVALRKEWPSKRSLLSERGIA